MVPEICSATDKNFCHFGPFFALLPLPPKKKQKLKNQYFEKTKNRPGDIIILHMCTINVNMMYGSWDMKYDRIFCHLGPFFALLPQQPKESKF